MPDHLMMFLLFYPKELQLGFLKLLRGTSLRKEAEKYGYVYDENPPYELLYSNDLSPEDIGKNSFGRRNVREILE